MANQHSIFKICVSAWVARETHGRLVKKAKARGFKTLTDYVEHIYEQEIRNVHLTPEDHRKIAEDIEAARRRVDLRAGQRKSPPR